MPDLVVQLLSPKLIALYLFIASAVYVLQRGQVRHRWSRELTSHSTFLAPVNSVMYLSSKVPNQPILDVNDFPQLQVLRDNWEMIAEEAKGLYEQGEVKASEKLDDIAFNSFFRRGWKRFYLKWYGSSLPSAQNLCPKTVALLESIPSIKGAMFTLLPPGGELMKHRDPYAGSLRYHLGLITPNSDDCRIFVDGHQYSWRDGQDLVFDETYIHHAENKTDTDRIILFCDVKRPLNNPVAEAVNWVFSRTVMASSAARNLPGDKVGALNKAFAGLYQIRRVGRWLKDRNKPIYYLIKYAIFVGLAWLIFFR